MQRERPVPPRPDLNRKPTGAFGWLDARILRDGWLARLGPEATATLTFLALAADRQGTSFYGRGRMAATLGIELAALDRALARLRDLGLVAHRPWRPGNPDGVWQLLPIPASTSSRDHSPSAPTALRDIINALTLPPSQA